MVCFSKMPFFTFRKAVNCTLKGHLLQAKRRHIAKWLIVSAFPMGGLSPPGYAWSKVASGENFAILPFVQLGWQR